MEDLFGHFAEEYSEDIREEESEKTKFLICNSISEFKKKYNVTNEELIKIFNKDEYLVEDILNFNFNSISLNDLLEIEYILTHFTNSS